MEIRRFGIGHRRLDGPPGTKGVTAAIVDAGPHGMVSELAFGRGASMEAHSNPNRTWFVVIEGGGFVLVGEQRARVAAGEAVLWPEGVVHAAWTELSEMRAIIVELAGADPGGIAGLIDGHARQVAVGGGAGGGSPAAPIGGLRSGRSATYDPSEGEPA